MINFKVSGAAAVVAFLLSFLIGLVSRSGMPELIVRPLVFALVFFVLSGAIYYLVSHFLPELLSSDSGDYANGARVSGADSHLGSRINITEGDSPFVPSYTQSDPSQGGAGFAGQGFMGAQPDDSEENLGNISELFLKGDTFGNDSMNTGLGTESFETQPAGMPGAGIDQNAQDQYNGREGDTEKFPKTDQFAPWEPPSFSSGADAGTEGSVAEKPGTPAPVSPIAMSSSADFFPDLDAMAGAFRPSSSEGGSASAGYSIFDAPPKRARSKDAPPWADDFNAKEIAMGLRTALNKDKEG